MKTNPTPLEHKDNMTMKHYLLKDFTDAEWSRIADAHASSNPQDFHQLLRDIVEDTDKIKEYDSMFIDCLLFDNKNHRLEIRVTERK